MTLGLAIGLALAALAIMHLWFDRAREITRLSAEIVAQREAVAVERQTVKDLTDRMMTMRVEHRFTEGGDPPPEPPVKLPAEMEALLGHLPLEMQYETRDWCREQIQHGRPVPDIMQELDTHGDRVADEVLGIYG